VDIQAVVQAIEMQCPGAIAEVTPGWLVIKKEQLRELAGILKNGPLAFASLHCITAVDRKETVEVVYHLYSFEQHFLLTLKVILPDEALLIDSLTPLWEGANWLEREVFDLFGVRFTHHPDLRRILNPVEWTDHPLRKNFKRADFIPRPVN